jgi:hypothetical protein
VRQKKASALEPNDQDPANPGTVQSGTEIPKPDFYIYTRGQAPTSSSFDETGFPRKKIMTNMGEEVDWPVAHSPRIPRDKNIVSKTQMAKLMTQAGFGDLESARRVEQSYRYVVSDPEARARWMIITALLKEDSSSIGGNYFDELNGASPETRSAFEKTQKRLEGFLTNIKANDPDPFK